MRFALFLAIMLLVAMCAVCLAPFQAPTRPVADRASVEARLDRTVGDQIAWRSIPGVSVAVVGSDAELKTWVAGHRGLLGSPKITPQTQFEVASLSKPVTAYAALQLVQAGRLNLDGAIERGGYTFTLRQLLSHSAGFDNSLSLPPRPTGPGTGFRYAGSGYLVVAEEIERVTGVPFDKYMNRTVLPGIGMRHSSFGPTSDGRVAMAEPSIDLALPTLAVCAIATGLGVPLLLLHALVCRFVRQPRAWLLSAVPRGIFLLSLVAGVVGVAWVLGPKNFWVPLAVAGLIVLAAAGAKLASSLRLPLRVVAGLLVLTAVLLVAWRPALPMAPRKPVFLAAAGLRTTPTDYALFLQEVSRPRRLDPKLAELMRLPAVAVDSDNGWALGLGVHLKPRPAIWHWGVNFPGYQAFAVSVPETGQIVVIAMNGGALVPRLGGVRYSGLELARAGVAALGVPLPGSLWEGVQ